MTQLLQIMQKEVDAFVEHYQTDFTVHDTKYLLERAKSGERYYWLIRKSGTQLYNEKDLLVKGSLWNERDLLYYFGDYDKKFFELNITSNNDFSLEGSIQEINYDNFCKELKQKLKTPSKLKIVYKDETYFYDWKYISTPGQFMNYLITQFKEHIDWHMIEYDFIF